MTTATRSSVRLVALRGAFDLRLSSAFGFGQREAGHDQDVLELAFLLEPTWEPVAVVVRQPAPDALELEVTGPADVDAAVAQALRVISADVDATGWDALCAADPVLGRIRSAKPGLRPPLFHSAYEALAWCVLSARRPHAQGVALRERLNRAHGTVLDVAAGPGAGGAELTVLPSPEQLLAVTELPGLPEVKLRRLHGIARAALDGQLATDELRAVDPVDAILRLRELEGIGPYYAELVTVRALGHTDVVPLLEPAVAAVAGALLTGNGPLTAAELATRTAAWSPWRTWACVAMRSAGPALVGATTSR
jgi:DNA-3-methyladenine glycosylase II